MTDLKRFRYFRVVVSFLAVLVLFLTIGDVLLLSKQREIFLQEAERSAQEELYLMGYLIQDALLRGDYATVERFLKKWGEEHAKVVKIRAVASNGFVLSEYVRAEPAEYPFEVSSEVDYSGRNLITLKMTRDFGDLEARLEKLLNQSVAVSIVFTALLGLILWFTLRRTALVPMELMIGEIEKSKENLEDRVKERTAELVRINEELEAEIGSRRVAEKRLKYSESYLRSIFETEPECVSIVAPGGAVLEINPAGLEMFEADSIEQVAGKPIVQVVAPEFREDFGEFLGRVCEGNKESFEYRVIGLKGTPRWLESHAVPFFDEKTNNIVMLAVTRDNTGHRKLEAQLRHSQKMEAIGTLTGGIAHEFNNILTAIIGYSEFLHEAIPKVDPMATYVEMIQTSALRAANLTHSLLTYSRKQTITLEPMDLNSVIRNYEDFLSRSVPENVRLKFLLSNGSPLRVMLDRSQIEQVLANLVKNSADALPEGGEVSISTEIVEVDADFIRAYSYGKPGVYAVLAVSDSGIGMDQETREKIFEPFFTTKPVGKGTGLGLSLVYGIVKRHNGLINVYSEPGKGTTFRIYIPFLKRAGMKVKKETGMPPPVAGTETVLLAEDDIGVKGLTEMILSRNGYKVLAASDGIEALRIFDEHRDDVKLLLLDVVMPGKNGREVYEEIRKIRPGIKVIFISGYTADIIEKSGVYEGDFCFISKPVSPKKLLSGVREVLDK